MDNLADATQLVEAGRLEEAREIIVDILYRDYDNVDAWLLLTRCPVDHDEYIRAIREVLRLEPENVEARRLAVNLARSSTTSEAQRRHRSLRSFANLVMLVIVVGAGVLLAFLLLYEQEPDTNTPAQALPTLDPVDACTQQIESVLRRLPARCGFLEPNEVCLGNPVVTFDPDTIAVVLPGDRALVSDLKTLRLGPDGLVVLATNPDTTLVLTGGVRLSNFDADLTQLVLSSNPVTQECPAAWPSGLLVNAPGLVNFTLNSMVVEMDGSAFFQVDAAAGLRVVVFSGQATVRSAEAGRLIQAGQWLRWTVDPTLQIEGTPGDVMISGNSVRGKLAPLAHLSAALELESDEWQFPGPPPAVAAEPTATATATVSPTATPSPTASATETQAPPPTASVTVTPIVQEVTPTRLPVLETRIDGVWSCDVTLGDIEFAYIISIEPVRDASNVLASGSLPEFGNSIVALAGEWITDRSALDREWERLAVDEPALGWLILREVGVVYDTGEYGAGGILRLVQTERGLMKGGIFNNDQLLGIVNFCEIPG